jgi:DNA-binding NarL/FixJ family response regulator
LERGYGTDYLARITYQHLVEISDDNLAHACNNLNGRSARDRYRLVGEHLPGTVRAMLALSDRRDVEFLGKEEEVMVRVAVVDDQRLFARGLSGLVDLLPETEVVGVAYDGEEAVELCRKEEPDVILMDISMPKMDGISATREIRDLLPQTAVIILTAHEDDEHVFEGIKAGAQGYLLKDAELEDLSLAIRTVHAGNTIIAPDLAQKMLNTFEGTEGPTGKRLVPPLTERELEVIRALAQGKSDRQIAQSLGISEKTVNNHTSNIYRKLHLFDRTQAVIYAVREGVIDVEELEYRSPEE